MGTAMLSGETQTFHSVSLGPLQFGQLSNDFLADHFGHLGDAVIVDSLSSGWDPRRLGSGALAPQRPQEKAAETIEFRLALL
jgi:hypothetical protein